MEFQNTIAYGQFYNVGGAVTPVAATFVQFGYSAAAVDDLTKNIHSSGDATDYEITVQQDGAYFYDISFIAGGGGGKTYTLGTFVNGVADATQEAITFFQQNTEQRYEVSYNNIVNLSAGDTLSFGVSVVTVSATAFSLNNIKLCIYNLQQLGSH